MRWHESSIACALLLLAGSLPAQETFHPRGVLPASDAQPPASATGHAILAFSPPALEAAARRAEVRNSFTLDRTALSALGAFLPESQSDVRPAIRKLDGISVHLYRFHDIGEVDQAQLEEARAACTARGWQHLVHQGKSDPLHKRTDLWLSFDGIEVRGGAMMLVTPKSVTLVTFAGDLNPVDVLHLRGHFGIPAGGPDSPPDVK